MAELETRQFDVLVDILVKAGRSQAEAQLLANRIWGEVAGSSEPLSEIDTILWRDYGEKAAQAWNNSYDAQAVAEQTDAGTEAAGAAVLPGAGLTQERRDEIDQQMLAGASPDLYIGEDREYAASVVDPASGGANLDIIEARRKIAADETDANERALFNQVFSPEMRQRAVDEYNASNTGQDVSSYNELLERFANEDPQAEMVIENSVMGQADDYVRVATGVGKNGITYEYIDSATNEAFKARGLNANEVASVIRGQKVHGIDVDAAVAITNYTNMLGNTNPARILELQQELKKAEAEAASASKFGSADPERTRFLRQRVQSLRESIRQEEAKSETRTTTNQAYVSQNMARYEGFRDNLGGHYDLALIAMLDPALAGRIYEQGNTVGLTGEDFATIQKAFVSAGVSNAETGRNLIGDSAGANAWLPGMTDEQYAMLTGGPGGAGGGGADDTYVKYTLPDPTAVKEGLRNLYASWYMSAPTDEELDAFTNVINTKTKQEAMKQVPPTAAANNAYRAWGDTSGNYGGGGGQVIDLGNVGVDEYGQGVTAGRQRAEYQDLFGKKSADVTEGQYASQFASQAQTMLGAEGTTAVDAIQQGMRGNEMNATSRMVMYDKKYRDSSTLMGRMATSAQAIARYI